MIKQMNKKKIREIERLHEIKKVPEASERNLIKRRTINPKPSYYPDPSSKRERRTNPKLRSWRIGKSKNEFILRNYEEFRRHIEYLRTTCEDSRLYFLESRVHLNRDLLDFKAEDERSINLTLFSNGLRHDLEMQIQQNCLTFFATRIEKLKDWETELKNCEKLLEKLLSIEDRYMRIMLERGIGPYIPWLAALDGEYLSDQGWWVCVIQ